MEAVVAHARSQGSRRKLRSCTVLQASGGCLNSYCPGFQDIRARRLCELAMPPRINASSISTVRCWMHTIRDGAADLLRLILRRTSSLFCWTTWLKSGAIRTKGISEIRGPRQHFTHSKVMAWVAFDRAIKLAEHFALPGPIDQWKALRQTIHDDVCAKAFNVERGAFVQHYGANTLDASVLLMPLVGFLSVTNSRVIGTVEAIERNLTVRGFVLRYDTERAEDGLPPGEGAFLPCSFWLADCLLMLGRIRDAREAIRKTDGPVQRCRASGGRIRPANGTPYRQFSPGFLAHRPRQYRSQPRSCLQTSARASGAPSRNAYVQWTGRALNELEAGKTMPFKVEVGPPQIAISHGQTVLITDLDGQFHWPSERGLFFLDTRVLSSWAVSANPCALAPFERRRDNLLHFGCPTDQSRHP